MARNHVESILWILIGGGLLLLSILPQLPATGESSQVANFSRIRKSFNFNLDLTSPVTSGSNKRIVSSYGEKCRTDSDCDGQFGLVCNNGTCRCSQEYIARLNMNTGKFFNTERRTECMLRAGSKCDKRDVTSSRAFSTYIWTKLRKNMQSFGEDFIRSDSNCVDNAYCVAGHCRCSTKHFQDFRGLCLKKRTVFQPCDSDHQCQASEGLLCSNGTCQCRSSMTYDIISKACLVPVGGDCDAYSGPSGQKDSDGFSLKDKECVKNAECSNDRCVCLDGYTVTSNGACGVAHGSLCDTTDYICADIQLACRSGRCQCRYPVHQVYNETIKQCVSKPDGPCTPRKFSGYSYHQHSFKQNCVPFAECVSTEIESGDDSMFEYICKCSQGYAEDSSGNCIPSYSSGNQLSVSYFDILATCWYFQIAMI